jgi:hypothetical protein
VVTLNGGTWTAAQLNTTSQAWFFPCQGTPGTKGACGLPPTTQTGDPATYLLAFQDSTHAFLQDLNGNTTNYQGSSGNKGFAYGGGVVGWATQPFMAGIVAAGLDLEAQAMYDGGFDPATGALLYQYGEGSVQWLKTYGIRASTKGVYSFVGGANCPAGHIAESFSWCMTSATPTNPEADRILSSEAVRGMMFNWFNYSHDPAMAATIDMLVNAEWAKPGTCPAGSTLCVSDGYYMPSYDAGGWWVSGTPPAGTNPKWFGMPFGLNPQASWPAMRLVGSQMQRGRPSR